MNRSIALANLDALFARIDAELESDFASSTDEDVDDMLREVDAFGAYIRPNADDV